MRHELEQEGEEFTEDKITETEEGCCRKRDDHDHDGITSGLFPARPVYMSHFCLRSFYIFCDAHKCVCDDSCL
jgi:hypothetical protein